MPPCRYPAAMPVDERRPDMRFTDLFVRRPVLAAVVSLLILLIGLRASSSCRCGSIPS